MFGWLWDVMGRGLFGFGGWSKREWDGKMINARNVLSYTSAISIHIVHRTCRACNGTEISDAQRKNKTHVDQLPNEVSPRMQSIYQLLRL
jgi:hypothetical protein